MAAGVRSLYSLQVGRAYAALAVVLFHANLIVSLPKYMGREPAPFARFGFAGVDYFFVLSGFVIVIAHWQDLIGNPRPADFAWKRFRRLFPPLWIILLPLSVLYLLEPGLSPVQNLNFIDYIWSFAILPPYDAFRNEPLLAVMWTLRFEIVFYAIFLLYICNRIASMAVVIPIVSLAVFSLTRSAEYIYPFWITPYPLLFVFGAAAGFAYKQGFRPHPALLLSAGVLTLLFAAVTAASEAGGYRSSWLTGAFGVGSVATILGAALTEDLDPGVVIRVIAKIGDASYAIYLIHYPLISILIKAMVKADPLMPPIGAFSLLVMASIGAGLAFHIMIEKPLLAFLPARLGKRRAE